MAEKLRGKTLQDMRKKANLSQWCVARALGKTQGWLSNIEMGYVTPPEDVVLEVAVAIKTLGAKPGQQNGGLCGANPQIV